MNDLIQNIIFYSSGIFDEYPVGLKLIRKIMLKDLIKNSAIEIYLYINENKIHIYPIEIISSPCMEYNTAQGIETTTEIEINGAKEFANYIFKTQVYDIRFKKLTYSIDIQEGIGEEFWKLDTLVNVYSKDYIPEGYFILKNDMFRNINIISTILHREELNNYINKLDYRNV